MVRLLFSSFSQCLTSKLKPVCHYESTPQPFSLKDNYNSVKVYVFVLSSHPNSQKIAMKRNEHRLINCQNVHIFLYCTRRRPWNRVLAVCLCVWGFPLRLKCLSQRHTCGVFVMERLSHISIQRCPLVLQKNTCLEIQRILMCFSPYHSDWWESLCQWKDNTKDQSGAYWESDCLLYGVQWTWCGYQNYKCVIQ